MKFIAFCGIPASGKSTLATYMSKLIRARLYECDDFFKHNLCGKVNEAIALFHQNICNDLMGGFDVICDGTYTSKRSRLELLDGIKDVECKKVIIVLSIPLEECIKRNANREARIPELMVYDIHKKFEHPTLDEGWDEIIYVKEDGTYESDFTGD